MQLWRSGLTVLGLGLCAPVLAGSDMNPGLWEISMQLEMPGMPMAMAPITQTLCFTQEDVASGAKTIPQDNPDNPLHCRPENIAMNGSTASWKLRCDNMTGSGSMTYNGDSYSGSSDISMTMDGQTRQLRQTFSGKRLGDCVK